MLIDSIIIKLKRKGAGIKPDYNLTIYGHGNIIYQGYENVRVKGKIEKTIDREKILSLLSEFKKADFFSLNDVYPKEETANIPYTVISLSIKDENGDIKTKIISHYHDDQNVPRKLIDLEDKIDEITESKNWVFIPPAVETHPDIKKSELPSPAVKKKQYKINKGKLVKLIAGIIIISIVVILIVFAISSGIIQMNNSKDSSNNYGAPNIKLFETASFVENCSYSEKNEFEQGDFVYAYFEFSNVTHNGNYSISEEVIVYYDDIEVDRYDYTINSSSESNLFCDHCFFSTDESWLAGEYLVVIRLKDEISKKTATSETNFIILESNLSTFTASISTDPDYTLGSSPFTVKFYGSTTGGTPPYMWGWDFSYNAPNFTVDSTLQNPIRTFESSAGNMFYVKLRVTDTNGLRAEDSEFIFLTP